MGHMHRFYIPPETPNGPEVVVSGPEAHHALRVARLHAGDSVFLFDGRGREIDGVVATTARDQMVVSIKELRRVPPPGRRLTLSQAWLHQGKALDFVIQHGTEVGVARFLFFRAEHSEREPRQDAKWLRIAIEACKQCGRAWLPTFDIARDLGAVLETATGTVLIATRESEPVPFSQFPHGDEVTLLIGPEGDFSDAELRLAREREAIPVSLGRATYRSEVAAVLGAALALYELGELGPAPSAKK